MTMNRAARTGAAAFTMVAVAGLAAAAEPQRVAKDGVEVRFSARPVDGAAKLVEGGVAEVRFQIVDEVTGPRRAGARG